jgi:Ca2+-transporting ATPase
LQREMRDLARTLAVVAVAVSLLIPLTGLLRGDCLQEMILTWLSLTFLMVPGQPPIIIAMALALAPLELARKQVIVRHLQGAEALGAVTTLLSVRTGAMAQNRMTLHRLVPGASEPLDTAQAAAAGAVPLPGRGQADPAQHGRPDGCHPRGLPRLLRAGP